MDKMLTEEEERHLRALQLFWEAHGRSDLAKRADEVSPAVQRLAITMFHQWLENPEGLATAYKWSVRLFPIIRAYALVKEKVTKIFRR
jgi:hypothetical protein